jgi:hypothetical protein
MIIYQKPNTSIIIAAVGWVIGKLVPGPIGVMGNVVFTIAIIIWAYEEIVHGVNRFRKFLGWIVLLLVAGSLFMQLK